MHCGYTPANICFLVISFKGIVSLANCPLCIVILILSLSPSLNLPSVLYDSNLLSQSGVPLHIAMQRNLALLVYNSLERLALSMQASISYCLIRLHRLRARIVCSCECFLPNSWKGKHLKYRFKECICSC